MEPSRPKKTIPAPQNYPQNKRKKARVSGTGYTSSAGVRVDGKKPGEDCECKRKCFERVQPLARECLFNYYYTLPSNSCQVLSDHEDSEDENDAVFAIIDEYMPENMDDEGNILEESDNEELKDMQVDDICSDSDVSMEDASLIDLNIQTSDKNLIMSEIRPLDFIFEDLEDEESDNDSENHDGEHHENEELTDMQIGDICCDSDLSPEDTPLIDLNIQTSDKNLIMSEIRSLDIIFADLEDLWE